jgi:hypothetical protein
MGTTVNTKKKSKLSIVNEAVAKQQVTSIDHLENFYVALIDNLEQSIDDKKYDLEGEERSYIKKLKDLQGKLKDAEKMVSETWTSVSSSKLTTVADINFQILNFWDSLELAKSLVFSLEDQIATTESSLSELKARGVLEILQMELYLDHLKK